MSNEMSLREFDPPLAVEHLVFEVKAEAFETWKAAEFEYWTTTEAALFPTYRGKETWVLKGDGFYRVTVIIYWDGTDEWYSIDPLWLEEQERTFAEVVGADNYRLVSAFHETDQYYKISEYR